MKSNVSDHNKYLNALVEYLDEGRLRPGLVIRAQGQQLVLLEAGGREHVVTRDLVLLAHHELKADRENLTEMIAALRAERERFGAELDLNLLWEVVREQRRSFTAEELAELFFGKRIPSATSVMFEALFNDRLYFVRRHMEFVARSAEQVDRLRVQYDRIRQRSEAGRKTRDLIRTIIDDGVIPPPSETEELVTELTRYLENPFTRNREMASLMEGLITEMSPAEAAYEMLERLGHPPAGPRFAVIGGLRNEFSALANAEAISVVTPLREHNADNAAITIDDDDTLEVDDALSCEPLPDGGLRVLTHIALVADFVAKGGAMDKEAGARAATVYLPEATIRMLPDHISCDSASLIAGQERHVMTTDIRLSASGELIGYSIYPARIRVAARLSYDVADGYITGGPAESKAAGALAVRRLHEAAIRLRERRRSAGALLMQRRETKIKVSDGAVDIKIIDNSSPSRQLVAEFMVLSNHAGARYAAENRIPIIYRVQPITGAELANQRPRLSLYPEYHAGIGLDCYAQLSSPIRRYMDLVLQRQLLAALIGGRLPYEPDELLAILANSENAEAESRELERRAKRYWTLRYLQRHALNRPIEAIALRDGASAELDAYTVRGTLHGAPNLASQSRITVRIARLDPARGWLTFDYLGTVSEMSDSVT